MNNRRNIILAGIVLFSLACLGIFALPAVQERFWWRFDQLRIRVQYAIRPPEEAVFTPDPRVVAAVQTTLTSQAVEKSPTPAPTSTLTPTPLPVDAPTLTPTVPPTPLPALVKIENVPYVDQHYGFNNCAPATLTMALNFWGDPVKREEVSKWLKPFDKDKNVMPYELADYVNGQTTGLKALDRVGGTIDLIKRLVAAGYPVIVERGVYLRDLTGKFSWMGHYQYAYGYDDAQGKFLVKDAFVPDGANFKVTYEDLILGWRSFNYAFVVLYPADKEADLTRLLGEYADPDQAARIAYETASAEASKLTGQDQFFAWYNRGSSMVKLNDYNGAAQAYDQAFQFYATLPADKRPWRVVWYQTGPYFAYYYTGRYQDVIGLADKTISAASEPFIEESFYWRALAKVALEDKKGAESDLRKSLEYHPGFDPSLNLLQQIGATP